MTPNEWAAVIVCIVGAILLFAFVLRLDRPSDVHPVPPRPLMLGIANAKAKRRAKHDAAMLALYRDWPPDLVDTFLEWERRRRYGEYSPSGYIHWDEGMSYADHLAHPREGVVRMWR